MKKTIVFCILLSVSSSLFTNRCLADRCKDLQDRLDKIKMFHATFVQQVIDNQGKIIYRGQGDLWVKRPNLFNCHILNPSELILISDGITLWIYNPLIKQAIATYLQDVQNISRNIEIFMSIFYNKNNDWQHRYHINQYGDDFILIPKAYNNYLKQFIIKVSYDGIIHQLSATDHNNQNNTYQITVQQQGDKVDESKFSFILPKGVTLDDQRIDKNR